VNELRIDSMSGDKIIFSADRINRPMDNPESKDKAYNENCPFCVGNENKSIETFRIEKNDKWLVRAVNNKYPIIDNVSKNLFGIHEVMIENNRHDANFYDMDDLEFKNILIMYKNRFCELINCENVEYVSIFKNYLRQAGASLAHPHSQIITLPFVAPQIKEELEISKKYFEKNNKNLYEDIIQEEIKISKRVIFNGKNFLAVIPYTSKFSGEIRILFKRNIRFDEINDCEIEELATIFRKIFLKIKEIEGDIPFNMYIHTHPANLDTKKYFNTHIHIIPRKYNIGGFELSTGVYVSSRNPDDLAKKFKVE
jgi:UDPglucose--hexose-1-phosphate uridylyltransferase